MCQGGGEGGAGRWGEKRAGDQHWVDNWTDVVENWDLPSNRGLVTDAQHFLQIFLGTTGSSCFSCRIGLIRTGLELLRDKRLV